MAANASGSAERMSLTKVLEAPPELVWKAWTDPHYMGKWWSPRGFTTPVCKIDFRVGGKFLYCMKAPDGQEFWGGGDYLEIVPHRKIVMSMYFADAEGNRVDPAHRGIAHQALEGAHDIVTFEDLGQGRTKLTFVGNETMENALKTGQLEGMNQMLEKFTAVVAQLVAAG